MKNKWAYGVSFPPLCSGLRVLMVLCLFTLWGLCTACDGTGLGGDGSLRDLAEGQKKILERLEKLEKSQQEILASAAKGVPQRPQVDYDKVVDIAMGSSAFRGPKDAAVTLVEFSDFQCPYSQRLQPLLLELLSAYPDDLKHVFKNYPLRFHARAEPAARACMAAGLQGRFWQMHEKIFQDPKKLEDSDLAEYAKQLDLNVEKFQKDYQSDTVKNLVAADMEEARKAQVTGTPTLFLNGKRVKDRSPEGMKKEIETLRDQKKKG